jgi:hypothetical protein
VIFIGTTIFTQQISNLLSDDAYAEFQQYLADNPTSGDVIQGTGGLRKIRWSCKNMGKRGGLRVVYFHVSADCQIRLLLAYKKSVADDLTAQQKTALQHSIQRWNQ